MSGQFAWANPVWLDGKRLSLCLHSEGSWRKCLGVGVRLSLDEPAIDVFFLWWMASLTSREHAEWIREQEHAFDTQKEYSIPF